MTPPPHVRFACTDRGRHDLWTFRQSNPFDHRDAWDAHGAGRPQVVETDILQVLPVDGGTTVRLRYHCPRCERTYVFASGWVERLTEAADRARRAGLSRVDLSYL